MLIYSWTLIILFCVMLFWFCYSQWLQTVRLLLGVVYSCSMLYLCEKITSFLNNLTLYMDWLIWNFWIEGFLFRIVYFVSLFMVCLYCRLFPRLWKCTSQMQLCFSVVLTLWPVIDLVALIFHWKVIAEIKSKELSGGFQSEQ